MLINLRTYRSENEQQKATIEIEQRLPSHVSDKAVIECNYSINRIDDYFLLSLKLNSNLKLICQRCLGTFKYSYSKETELAISSNEKTLERLMDTYDCIAAPNLTFELKDILTDELYLYVPEFHADYKDCDEVINSYINEKNSINAIK